MELLALIYDAGVHFGTDGDDVSLGGDAVDWYYSSAGDDVFDARGGDDGFSIELDSGNDVIFAGSGNEYLRFEDGITLENLIVETGNFSGNSRIDTKISFANGSGSVVIDHTHYNAFGGSGAWLIENFEIEGVTYSWSELLDLTLYAGSDGSDTIWGTYEANVFQASLGDDVLYGQSGDDQFHVELNHGDDIIYAGYGSETMIFGAGITLDDLIVETGNFSGNFRIDTKISFANGSGSVVIDHTHYNAFGGSGAWLIENFEIEGVTYSWSELLDLTLYAGTDGSDTIWGTYEADVFQASLGDDVLYGQSGADVFVFSDTSGSDVVYDLTSEDVIDLSGVSAIGSFSDVTANATDTGSDLVIALSVIGGAILGHGSGGIVLSRAA